MKGVPTEAKVPGDANKDAKEIPLLELGKDNPKAWLEFSWQMHPEKVKEAFKKTGVEVIDKEDMYSLLDLHRTGGDIEGDLKTPSGKPVHFDFVEVLKGIEWDQDKFSNTFGITPDKKLLSRKA
jgi:hypothetical protein